MRIAFLVFNIDGTGGTERSVVTQANALVRSGHDVSILSVVREAAQPHYEVDPGVDLRSLVDRTDPEHPQAGAITDHELAARLDALPSLLVPERWDAQFSGLTDAACEAALPGLEADVLVTVTPGLLAIAVELVSARTALVHQEHRSSSDRTSGMECLLAYAPRADVVSLLTPSMEEWLVDTLGPAAPTTVVVPNPLPIGFAPRSTLDTRLVVAAGRFMAEKQLTRLVQAFGDVADRMPGWRLRILGSGPQRLDLVRLIRRLGLYDRVELAGQSADMPSEWAMASISALPSRSEGLPLVVQEAMAAGVPVAAFDNPSGARALITHEVDGLLVGPDATAGLATALLRLASDDELRRRLGAAAVESSRRYSAERIAERWTTIFEAASSRRTSQAGRVTQRVVELAAQTYTPRTEPAAVTDTTPAEARAIALGWAVACADRVSERWFVLPPHGSDVATVVVPMSARPAFLRELGGRQAPELLSLVDTAGHGWPERRGTLPELATALADHRTGRVSLEPWPLRDGWPGLLAVGCRVDVEFWESAPDGSLVAVGPNPYTNQVPQGVSTVASEVYGVPVRTLELMTEPTLADRTFPIDAVYTWVDGADPDWNAAREARLSTLSGAVLRKESSGRARFISRDELRYSLRSLHLFAPWLRTIHLVTAGQVPGWLTEHPKVRLVDHRDILPADALPTFNSHAIETSLHKVPGLAEHFVYLNDDFLLGRPLGPERFFTAAGLTSVFLSSNNLGIEELTDSPPWLKAAWNNRRLLRETFGTISTHSLAHAPYALRRSVLEEIEARFPDQLARTARAPFRTDDDISLLSSFAQHYGLMTGSAVLATAETAYVDISANDVARRLRRLQSREQDFICLGDHHDHALKPHALRDLLERFFEHYLPIPAPWEHSAEPQST